MDSLELFLEKINTLSHTQVSLCELPRDQAEMLHATLDYCVSNPFSDPLSILYFIAKPTTPLSLLLSERFLYIAVFCRLFLVAADLLDDVHDNELTGKPHERYGPHIASNNSVCLLFLAWKALDQALLIDSNSNKDSLFRARLHQVFFKISKGQHLDITLRNTPLSLDNLGLLHESKTAALSLVVEAGCFIADRPESDSASYRKFASHFTCLVQIIDDIRDIFGKEVSSDLINGSPSYPIACFQGRAQASTLEDYKDLLTELPSSIDTIRRVLYDSGAIAQCCERIEFHRESIYQSFGQLTEPSAYDRTLLFNLDRACESLYELPDIARPQKLDQIGGAWSEKVSDLQSRFLENCSSLGRPNPVPRLVAWHLPHWMFEPRRNCIYFPDLDNQLDEISVFQTMLLGGAASSSAAEIMVQQAPVVVAHEMFHFWRHNCGAISNDHWHEEWVANALAIAYLSKFLPEDLSQTIKLANAIVSEHGDCIDDLALHVLSSCHEPGKSGISGYGMDAFKQAVVGVELFRRLSQQDRLLESLASEYLRIK